MCGVQFLGNWGDVEDFCPVLKIFTEGAVTMVARILEYLVGVSSKAAACGREKKISSDQHPKDP